MPRRALVDAPKKMSWVLKFPKLSRVYLISLVLGLLILALIWGAQIPGRHNFTSEVTINSGTISVTIADSEPERIKGLSGRQFLADNTGMWFVFDNLGYHGIWMKDMRFAIDIIWLDEDYQVVDLVTNVSPDSYPQVFKPKAPARYVLEAPAGLANKHGVHVGQSAKIKNMRY